MVKIFRESWNYWMLHFTAQENWRLSAGSLLLYYDGFDHTLHWFLSVLLSCLACCFSVDHQGGEGLKMQVGEITLMPLLDYLPTIGLSYSLIDIIKMKYCSTEANMSDNYFVTLQWRWAFSSRNRKCKFNNNITSMFFNLLEQR